MKWESYAKNWEKIVHNIKNMWKSFSSFSPNLP